MRLFEPAYKNFFKRKKLILYIISISITFGFILSIVYCMTLLNDVLENKIKNNIANRVLFVSSDYEFSDSKMDEINNLEHIDVAYKGINSGISITMEDNYYFSVGYCMNEEIQNVNKGNLFDDEDNYQIIIPNFVYDRTNTRVDLSDYLGKEVTLKLNNITVTANIVGIQEGNRGYLYINEALKNYIVSVNKKIETQIYITAIVDDYKNVDLVIDELRNKFDCSANLSNISGQADIKLYNIAFLLVIVILVLAVVFNYVSVSIIISNIINDETMDIAIFKAIGYKVKDIYIIMKYRILAIIGISIAISVIIAILINQIINFILKYKLEIILKSDYGMFICILLLFTVFIYILSIISVKLNNKKIKKINTIDLLKEK